MSNELQDPVPTEETVTIPRVVFNDLMETLGRWPDTYSAFQAAFDTPVARRQMDDAYSNDARSRLRDINTRMFYHRTYLKGKV